MDRPLTDATSVEWRKYAESLEERLSKLEPKDTGFRLWGIPLIADKSVPEGEAQLRYDGVVVGRVKELGAFLTLVRRGDWKSLEAIVREINKVKTTFYQEPTEIAVTPEVEYEPGPEGIFRRIKGETDEQYLTRWRLFTLHRDKFLCE